VVARPFSDEMGIYGGSRLVAFMQATHCMNCGIPSGALMVLQPDAWSFIAGLGLDDGVIDEVAGALFAFPAREHLALLRVWFADALEEPDSWDD